MGDETAHYCFGFAGAVPWTIYGPYWENNFEIGALVPGRSYMEQFQGDTCDERIDRIRDYHLSAFVDEKKPYHNLKYLSEGGKAEGGETVYTYEDRIRMSDLIQYQGPCCVYLVRAFHSPQERDCRLYVGYSDAFSLWLNGEKMAERSDTVWWTAENIHLNKVHIKKGVNYLAVRLCRRSLESCFSFVFLHNEEAALGLLSYPEHIVDFISESQEERRT